MKNIWILALALTVTNTVLAQDDEEQKRGFKKENLFMGGTVNLQFGNRITSLGISPYFGYSINKYLDVAASVNFNYTSFRDYYVPDDKLRQTVYGPGAFVRLFPVKFLFAQAQYEFNFLKQTYIPGSNNPGPKDKLTRDAHSFLIGPGYAGGRDGESKSFYYISVLWDVGNNKNSPYKDNLGRAVPIIRAGYN
ncbi:MAG: hypothetical protein EOP53_27750, partial [Sphingobacteriales bacterium]